MTVTTTAMPSTVAIPEVSISQRTRATICACAGLSGSSSSVSGLLMSELEVDAPIIETATISAVEAGQRLDRALAAHVRDLSRSRLKALILAGRVAISGRTIFDPGHRVNAGDEITVTVPAAEPAEPRPENIPLAIVYEDADIIVIDKPRGLVVHPAAGNWTGTLVNALLAHCGDSLSGIGGIRRPGIVHRLDKDTSGLMVVTKSEAAHQALARDFAARRVDRTYAAFVWGAPSLPAGEVVGNIGRSTVNRKKMAVVREGKGKPAVTRYRVERTFQTHAAILQCRLATGRTHQIRVHLASLGHPLIGDPVYGTRARRAIARAGPIGERIVAFARQALHAGRLGFTHPLDGRRLEFDSPLPRDMQDLTKSLEAL